jgi:RNA polymerase sigma-70 factor (ECF subfamily)
MPHEELMPAALADMAALGKILNDHRAELLAMLRRRLDQRLARRLDPEDILSEAFLRAQQRWPHCKEEAARQPRAWLYRLVHDCLIEAWRRHHRNRRNLEQDEIFPEDSSAQLVAGLIDSGTSPSAATAREELRQRMATALALLKEADREILWMRNYDRLSYPEVAAVLDITEGAATVRYFRALQRLREVWQHLYPEEGR